VTTEARCSIRVEAAVNVVLQHVHEANKIQPANISSLSIFGERVAHRTNMLINVGLFQIVVMMRIRSTPFWNSCTFSPSISTSFVLGSGLMDPEV
jgi:hypothetical protein